MGIVRGVMLTGAAVTGFVFVERIRHRGHPADVRRDVTKLGHTVAGRASDAAGFVGHAAGDLLTRAGEFADSAGTKVADVVADVGRAVADRTGSVFGAYAGMVDRVLPGHQEPAAAAPSAKQPAAKQPSAKKPAAKRAPAKRPAAKRAA